jgi:hypothetical protein
VEEMPHAFTQMGELSACRQGFLLASNFCYSTAVEEAEGCIRLPRPQTKIPPRRLASIV